MTLRARVKPRWPIVVQGTGGVTVGYDNGRATIGFDYEDSELGTELTQAVESATSSASDAETAQAAAEAAQAAAETAAALITYASKTEAETGTATNRVISPLRARQAIAADFVTLEYFLPEGFNFSSDVTPYLEAAAAHSAANDVTILVDGSKEYTITTDCELNDTGARFHWGNVKINVTESANMNHVFYTSNGTLQGRVGITISGSDQVHTGSLTIVGDGALQSTAGGTQLAGMAFYEVSNVHFLADLIVRNASAARFVMWCDNCVFGDVHGEDIIGTQTFAAGSGTQGDVEVVIGCTNTIFGNANGHNVHKAARYISYTEDANGDPIATDTCTFGDTFCFGDAATPGESSALSVRNATNCAFGRTWGNGVTNCLNIQRYNGDTAGAVDQCRFGWVHSSDPVGTNSTSGRVLGESGALVGENWIEGISANGGHFGLTTGFHTRTHIGRVILDDCVVGFALDVGDTRIGEVILTNHGTGANYYDDDAVFRIGAVRCLTGLGNNTSNIIYKIGTETNPGCFIGEIEYQLNGIGDPPLYLLLDDTNNGRDVRVWNCKGTGASGQLQFYNATEEEPEDYKAVDGWYWKQIALTESTGIAAGSAKSQNVNWAGIEAGDMAMMNILAAAPGAFSCFVNCYSNGVLNVSCYNASGSTLTWNTRNANLFVKFLD